MASTLNLVSTLVELLDSNYNQLDMYFQGAKTLLTIVRLEPGTRHIWAMIEEANAALKLLPPAA